MLENSEPELTIRLHGAFRVTSSDGRDLTPRGTKSQALLALLLACPDQTRHRNWVQDKLWSKRERAQGAASLRQTLSEIRRAWGPSSRVLVADRKTVRLVPGICTIEDPDLSLDFLEGMDAKDPEFEDWLTLMRQKTRPAKALSNLVVNLAETPTSHLPVAIIVDPDLHEMDHVTAEIISSDIARSLREIHGIASITMEPGSSVEPGQIKIAIRCVFANALCLVHCKCERGPSGHQFWSSAKRIQCAGAPPFENPLILKLVNDVAYAVGQSYGELNASSKQIAGRIGTIGKLIFSMDPAQQSQAGKILKEGENGEEYALASSWRILLDVIRLMERLEPNPANLSHDLAIRARALQERAPMNSMALASTAYVKLMVLDQSSEAALLAEQSTNINPANAYGWLARGFCALQRDEPALAHQFMLKAWSLESLSPHRYFWDSVAGVSAAASGNMKLAAQLFETSHSLSLNFRPPLRYLVALRAAEGNAKSASHYIDRLLCLEPDFSTDRLIRDPDYPATMIRKTGLLDQGALGLLGAL